MSNQQLAQEYILNGFRLHKDVSVTMYYLRNLAPEITEADVLAQWAELENGEIQW